MNFLLQLRILPTSLCLALIMAATAAYGSSAVRAAPQAEVDTIFAPYNTDHTAGCAVGVIHDGKWLVHKGYGMANLDNKVPITPETRFRMGSISKQFTAASTLLLVQQGKLSLDTDIRTILTELPDYGETVTIRDLLMHSSGLPEYGPDLHMTLQEEPDYFKKMGVKPASGKGDDAANPDYTDFNFISISDFYHRITQVKHLKFKPGTRFKYNNIGYFLLSQIVKRVSGMSLHDFAAKNIFQPLGMNDSFYNDRSRQVVLNRADGYVTLPNGLILRFDTALNIVGDGGVFTNLDDFYKWDQNFYHDRLGDGSGWITREMQTPNTQLTYSKDDTPEGGGTYAYGFGLDVIHKHGLLEIHHAGEYVGFNTDYSRYPKQKFSVILFCNGAQIDPEHLGNEVAALYLPALRADNKANP